MGKKKTYDCSGYATKYGTLCSDKRTIMEDAFKHQDGCQVPLVWNHNHSDLDGVIGHAVLENRKDGVYAYCTFNDTDHGREAKTLVEHGDIKSFSIYANQLTESISKTVKNGKDVSHGIIREVSLVLAGANPGAVIDDVIVHSEESAAKDGILLNLTEDACNLSVVEHSDSEESDEEDAEQESGDEPKPESEVAHADEKKENKTVQDVLDGLSDKKRLVFAAVLAAGAFGQNITPEEDDENQNEESSEEDKETIAEVLETFTEEEKTVLYAYLGQLSEEDEEDDEDEKEPENTKKEVSHTDMEENNIFMKKNAFETTGVVGAPKESLLSHAELDEIVHTAINGKNKLKDVFDSTVAAKIEELKKEDSTVEHSGITDIENLMPDYTHVNGGKPSILDNDTTWVGAVMAGVTSFPKLKIKSSYIDVTAEEARANGWVKANVAADSKKMEQTLLAVKRETDGQMVYVKQSYDRDDIIDADFDLIAFTKTEMKGKWSEEVARAILVGDGRNANAKNKIKADRIRPIATDTDNDVYTIAKTVGNASSTVAEDAVELIDAAVRASSEYRGSGNTTAFVKRAAYTEMILHRDTHGYRMYKSDNELATAMGAKKLVVVPDNIMGDVLMLIVDLRDYRLGSNPKANAHFFDDFDIDFNQEKYLLEGKCSGALVEPKSAIVFTKGTAAAE